MAEEIKEVAEEIKEVAEEIKEENGEVTKMEPVVIKKPLEKMTSIELKEMAKTIPGATGVSAMKKADLVSLIREFMVIKEEFSTEPKAKKNQKTQSKHQRIENKGRPASWRKKGSP